MLVLSFVLLLVGFFGIWATGIAERVRTEWDIGRFDKYSYSGNYDDLFEIVRNSRKEITAAMREHMESRAMSALVIGMICLIWAVDHRLSYRRLQRALVRREGSGAPQPSHAGARIANLGFSAVLVLVAAAAILHVGRLVPDWIHYSRAEIGARKARQVKAFLLEQGISVAHASWSSGKAPGLTLRLQGPDVNDIKALVDVPVRYLFLCRTQVKDLSPLKKCPLVNLSLQGSAVEDLSPLAGSPIFTLDLRETGIMDLTPLASMPNLQSVSLSRAQIMANLKPLRNLRITVQEVPGGPAYTTGGPAWRNEYEAHDAGRPEEP